MTLRDLLRRGLSLLLAGTLLWGSTPASALSFGQEQTSSSQAGKVPGTWTLDLWHYSGGYWKVGNKGSEQIRIEDAQIRALDQYLQANHRAVFSVPVPAEVASLLSEGVRGTDWQVAFADYRGRDCSLLFAESAPAEVVLKNGQVEFSATPVFHFNGSGASLRDYVPGMSVTVPLVDKKYGCNIYSIFGNGKTAVQGLGYYNEDDPSDTGSNAIHPSYILGKSGALEGGHPITLGVNVVDSAGYSIGSGTFAAAGACGLHFEFPVSLVFTDLRAPEPEDPGPGDGPDGPGSGEGPDGPGAGTDPAAPGEPDDPAEPGDPSDPALPVDGSDVAGLTAILDLPPLAYAGHDVEAKDHSLYEVDGKTMNAARAAELSLGKSSFAIVQKNAGTIRKSGKTGAVAVFTKPGTYQVKLTATASNGLKDTDTQSIQILKTPSILEDLGGVQKENRKQKLVLTVAQDPKHPVCELTIKLSEPQSGESIFVEKVFGGSERAPANSAHIKYRSLLDTGSDAYFLCAELDFLTKWHETRTLSYEIRVKDTAGGTDSASGAFEVAPDLPPLAVIELEDAYYRGEGTNVAAVTPVCASVSDGDALQRTWQFRTPGGAWQELSSLPLYADLSFGSRKSVRFGKTGVGPFDVMLTVKDVWTEETLPEYVSEADYLSHSAQKSSRVDNVAPRVSLDLLKSEKAEVFVLTESDKLARDVLAAAPSLKAALLQAGIAAEVSADFRQAAAGAKTGTLTEITTGGVGALDYRGSRLQLHSAYLGGMWNGGNLVSDGRCTYMLTPSVETYGGDPKYSINTYPFTLTARDSAGKTVWNASVSRSVLDSAAYLRDASWGFDADGTYLYLIDGGKTALFDIRTGTYVATLPAALGAFNLLTPEYIYAFKDSGIWRMPRSGGSLSCIYGAPVFCPVYLGGSVQFITKQDLGKGLGLYRGLFDGEKGSVRCSLLEGSLNGYALGAVPLAIDAAGAAFVRSANTLYAYDASNALIREIPSAASADSIASVFPVWSGDGRVRFLGMGGTARYPKSREVWCTVYGVYTEDVYTDRVSDPERFPNYGDPVVYALQDENGAIGVYFGCNYVYATGERYLDPVIFTFNGTFRNPMGFPMEEGFQSIRYASATANLNGTMDIKQIVHVAESPADEEERLKKKHLSYEADYTHYVSLSSASPDAVSSLMEEIAAAVKRMKEAGQNAAVLEGQGSIARNISLAPDTVYFYEYETTAEKDIFSVEASVAVPSGMEAAGQGYRTAAVHEENFDDAAVDRFFSADASALLGGRYRIGYLRTKEISGVRAQAGTSYPIRFTIPEGYKGLLITDFAYDCDPEPLAKGLLLSRGGGPEVQLDIPCSGISRLSGTYMHDALLESGSYVLNCRVMARTKRSGQTGEFWLDNLKIHLLQESAAEQEAGLRKLQTSSSVKGEGTVRRVSGSFTTPRQTLHYGSYPAERIAGLQNAFVSVREEMRGYTNTQTLDLAIPAGREALKAVFTGAGSGGSYSSSSGKPRYYDSSWTFDDTVFGINTRESNGIMALYELPGAVRFARRNLTGNHRLTAVSTPRYGGAASFSDVLLYLTRPGAVVPAALKEGRFFEEAGRLYAEDLVFSGGGRIAFAAPDGTAIRNLRIWTVSGQTEVSAYACRFQSEADLAGWSRSGVKAKIQPQKTEKEEPARIYAKGETINYQVYYSDFERDPSKKQHWVYSHEPLSDGKHPQAGKDLAAPIPKFWVDGKYTLTHWQDDSTGDPAYDKESNRVSITFYIQSGPGNDAPWIKSITTDPAAPKAGNTYTVRTTVDDKDKDPLTVTVEVYKDSGSKPIGSKTVKDLKPDAAGVYPAVVLSGLPAASPGTYDIVVTVKDGAGADVQTLRFKVKEERSLTGTVTHTAAWEANRLAWNEAKKGTAAVRPANMFWPGETLVLNAPAGGEPLSVDAQILEFPQYAARLARGSAGADGKVNFTGQLWHSSMLQTIGTAKPVPATVRFTARYADGGVLTWDVAIIFDQSNGSYYQLHRNY